MADIIIRLDVIVFSLFLMLFILFSMFRTSGSRTLREKLYLVLTVSVTVMLFLEIPYILVNGKPHWAWLNVVDNTIYHMVQTFPLVLYVLLMDFFVFQDKRRLKMLLGHWTPFLVVTMALPVINLFFPLFFVIDEQGFYQRRLLLPLMFGLNYVPLGAVFYFLWVHRHRIDRQFLLVLFLVPVPALLASVFQLLVPGLTLTWPFISLGVLGLGLSLQHKRLTEDYLTGAYNRQYLDEYLQLKVKNCKPGKTFSAFLIDVDNFKKINDEFGHKIGDEALIESVRIFRSAVRQTDFIARYGGDEFIIVFDISDLVSLQNLAARIQLAADQFNAGSGHFYNLTFSIGMGVFDPLVDKNLDTFIKRIDFDMYTVKRRKKTSMYMF